MLRFFRQIRKQLLSSNKITTYLTYAAGEIILVVIGILIALQINNWNEHRKVLKAEKDTITSLKLEFQQNQTTLAGSITNLEVILDATKRLLEHTGPDYQLGSLGNVDSLISMTPRMSVWDPSLYTLSDIKNSGKLSSLTNEELRLKLIEWESFYSNLLDWAEFYVTRGQGYFDFLGEHSLSRDLYANHWRIQVEPSRFEISNELLLRDPKFENQLAHKAALNSFMLGFYQDAETQLAEIIALCDQYDD